VAAPEPFEAVLVYPPSLSEDVPRNVALVVENATDVALAEVATSRLIHAMADFEYGERYTLPDELEAGPYSVLVVPAPGTDNFIGEGEWVDLGTFTVGQGRDVEAPAAWLDQASWLVDGDDESYTVLLSQAERTTGEPVRFQIDVADAATPLDGVPEDDSSWDGSMFFGSVAELAPVSDRATAVLRARAIDLQGNVGEWSAETPFDVQVEERRGGCSQAAGGAPRLWPALLALAAVAMRARRKAGASAGVARRPYGVRPRA